MVLVEMTKNNANHHTLDRSVWKHISRAVDQSWDRRAGVDRREFIGSAERLEAY